MTPRQRLRPRGSVSSLLPGALLCGHQHEHAVPAPRTQHGGHTGTFQVRRLSPGTSQRPPTRPFGGKRERALTQGYSCTVLPVASNTRPSDRKTYDALLPVEGKDARRRSLHGKLSSGDPLPLQPLPGAGGYSPTDLASGPTCAPS